MKSSGDDTDATLTECCDPEVSKEAKYSVATWDEEVALGLKRLSVSTASRGVETSPGEVEASG